MVPEVGIEPTRPLGQRILSPPRLPVPPLRHRGGHAEANIIKRVRGESTISVEERDSGKTVLKLSGNLFALVR